MTEDNPYSRFSREEMILRDHLAADRTVLANERTLLAYVRTALTLVVAGCTFVKFFDSPVFTVTGWIFIPAGLAVLVWGVVRYGQTRRRMRACFRQAAAQHE